ncbi:MAG TPA: hypothetical protein PKY81_03195 [bacterium]|nr:hypothetical protein [bacterium]
MKKDNLVLTVFFTVILLIIAKSAASSFDPRTMGLLGLLFFVVVFALALK